MLNLRKALAKSKDNHRKRRAGRPERRLFGVPLSDIEDKAEELLAERIVDELADEGAIRSVSEEVGAWPDKATPWKGAREVAADFVIDHVLEPLVRSLLREGRHVAR